MNYYSLQQAITLFSDADLSPFFDMPQIADLCRQGKLTPLFPYHLYISKPCWHEEDGRPRYAPSDTQKFDGHLTHDHLISLIDGYTDSLSLTNAAINTNDGMDILLFNSHQRDPEDTTPHPFMVGLENIRLAADQVHNCIDDMKAKQSKATQASGTDELSERSEKGYQTTIGILLELLTKEQRGRDKALFSSQSELATYIDQLGIRTQSAKTINDRFALANAALETARKSRPRAPE